LMTTELYQPEQEARERGGGDATIDTAEFPPVRRIVDKAYARATGSQLIHGNGVRLLVDAEQNYPAWLEAIRSARRVATHSSTAMPMGSSRPLKAPAKTSSVVGAVPISR